MRRIIVFFIALALTGACSGSITEATDDSRSSTGGARSGDPGGGSNSTAGGGGDAEGRSPPVRRLTRDEYTSTIRDLLGMADVDPAAGFLDDGTVAGFKNNAGSPISVELTNDYMQAAEMLAAKAVAKIDTSALLPCKPANGEAECARRFIETFGKRAYRRPLRDTEIQRLVGVYDTARSNPDLKYDFTGAIRLVLTTMLESPFFLNHIVEGSPATSAQATVVALTGYEVASELSYFLWGTMPDAALFAAADAGELATREGVETQARRLLGNGRARNAVAAFYRQWLDPANASQRWQTVQTQATAANLPADVADSMRQETATFVDHVVWEGDGRLSALLTAPFSYLNASLGRVYGLTTVKSSNLVRVDLDPTRRAGLLTQPSFLALRSHAAPIHRGLFVRSRLFCQSPPPPPPKIDTTLPPADPTKTTRQVLEAFFANPTCDGCHRLMNPIGFGMEAYDALGRYRSSENKKPIDQSGQILGTQDSDGMFVGVPDLAARLAASRQVKDCVARQWFGYAIGDLQFQGLEGSLDNVRGEFTASGGDLRGLLLSVVTSDAFRHRALPAKEEVCQ